MAHSLSAKKRVRQNEKRRTINRARKSQVKTQVKRLDAALSQGDIDAASAQLRVVAQKLDKVASTSTMHRNTAARKKSRLAKKVNTLKAKKSS